MIYQTNYNNQGVIVLSYHLPKNVYCNNNCISANVDFYIIVELFCHVNKLHNQDMTVYTHSVQLLLTFLM